MGTFLDIQGDPDEVSAVGARLRSMGETLNARAQEVLGEINAVHAERPWGSDKYGAAFEGSYYLVPEGAEDPLPIMVSEGLTNSGKRLTAVGDGTIRAMIGYQAADADNAHDINKVSP